MISSISLLAMVLVLKLGMLLAFSAARGRRLYMAGEAASWLVGIKGH